MSGIHWTIEHMRPFFFDSSAHPQIRSYPPLWYMVSGLILHVLGSERAIALLAVAGWVLRHTLLGMILKEAAPNSKWGALGAKSIHAVLPLSVLIDGKVNPEGLHAAISTLAVYLLWRMERQARLDGSFSIATAALFGVVAALALLTKATASVLVVVCAATCVWRGLHSLRQSGWPATWRRIIRPTLAAAAAWCAVSVVWCGPNLVQFGHPFPHVWAHAPPIQNQVLQEALLYRRPLGWALPFEWREYLDFPMVRSPTDPRPNFWASQVTGTWSDYYNRGFCRLSGGGRTDRVWGGLRGFLPMGEAWSVSSSCVAVFTRLLQVGILFSLASVISVFHVAWCHLRTKGEYGSLVLPATALTTVSFVMLFALAYPFDNAAVQNPRYLLPAVTPISSCLGITLARLESAVQNRGVAGGVAAVGIAVVFSGIAIVTLLVIYERFGT
jgi:hypothetical protein